MNAHVPDAKLRNASKARHGSIRIYDFRLAELLQAVSSVNLFIESLFFCLQKTLKHRAMAMYLSKCGLKIKFAVENLYL